MNPAPPKPPSKNADRKAMAAYWSELRRWAEALANWEADLDRREAELADPEEIYDDNGDVIDGCGCTTQDAEDGCDCPTCEDWRSRRAKGMMKRQQDAAKTGDEIQWLEDLWRLPDKRKKK
jgi:hypothetical protein